MSALIPKEGWSKNSNPTSATNALTGQIVKTSLPHTNAESNKRIAFRPVFSLLIALVADALDVAPPLSYIGDGLAFIALLATWGFRWEIALALIPELIPGISVFPTWTAVVMALWFQGEKPKSKA